MFFSYPANQLKFFNIDLQNTLKVVEHKLALNSPIEEFLTKIGLGQHVEKLKLKGYATVKHLEYLIGDTSVDLFLPIKQEILLGYVTN